MNIYILNIIKTITADRGQVECSVMVKKMAAPTSPLLYDHAIVLIFIFVIENPKQILLAPCEPSKRLWFPLNSPKYFMLPFQPQFQPAPLTIIVDTTQIYINMVTYTDNASTHVIYKLVGLYEAIRLFDILYYYLIV